MRECLKNLFLTDEEKYRRGFRKVSYSQCGEDILVDYVLTLRGIQRPSYLDIGANHPFFINNTAKFYLEGSHRINIEANHELIGNFLRHRPNDINLNVGVSDKRGAQDFYIMNDNTLSTFSRSE